MTWDEAASAVEEAVEAEVEGGTADLEARVTHLEARVTALEQEAPTPPTPEPPEPEPEPEPEPPTGGYPPSRTGKTYVPWGGSLPEPGLGQSVKDPAFAGTITRISGKERAQYPKKPAWNADGSLLMLNRDGPLLLDGKTYAIVSETPPWGSANVWSAVDPRYAYRSNGNRIERVDPVAKTTVTVKDFGRPVEVGAEGRQSLDDQTFVLGVDAKKGAILYDRKADRTYGPIAFPTDVDWVTTAPSGDGGLVRFSASGSGWGQGVWTLTRDMKQGRNISSGSHGDVMLDAAGDDIFVGLDGANYAAWRLADSRKTLVLEAAIGGHISGVAFKRPGWAYISNHVFGTGSNANPPGWDQLLAVKTDGSREVQVWCHARTVQQSSAYQYAYSTHAVPSPDGRKVTWGGAWQRSTGGTTLRGFVVEVDQ